MPPSFQRSTRPSESTDTGSSKRVAAFEQSVTDFAADIVPDSTTLARFASQASQAEGANLNAVAPLNSAVATFKQLIAAKVKSAELTRWGEGTIGLFLVVVAATVGWLGGPVVDGILAMGAIGLLAGIRDKLGKEADIQAQVKGTAAQFAALNTQNSAEQQLIQVVEQFWTPSLDWLSQMLTNLQSAETAVQGGNMAEAQQQSQATQTIWDELQSLAQPLTQVAYTAQPGSRHAAG